MRDGLSGYLSSQFWRLQSNTTGLVTLGQQLSGMWWQVCGEGSCWEASNHRQAPEPLIFPHFGATITLHPERQMAHILHFSRGQVSPFYLQLAGWPWQAKQYPCLPHPRIKWEQPTRHSVPHQSLFCKEQTTIISIPGNLMNIFCFSSLFLWQLLPVHVKLSCVFPRISCFIFFLGSVWNWVPINELFQREFSVSS